MSTHLRYTRPVPRVAFNLVAIALALIAALAPIDPALVERMYSRALYLDIQRVLTPVSNRVSFAILDLVGAITLLVLTVSLVRVLVSKRPGRAALSFMGGMIVWAAFCYLIFLALWGLNYRRQPLVAKLAFDTARVTPHQLLALATDSVTRLNQLRRPEISRWPELEDMRAVLEPAFEDTQQLLGQRPAVPGRPKWLVLAPYFRWAAIDGMIDPFFLEVLVRHDLLPFERPFVVAHEWAHLAGFADESEASFVGWLTCLRGLPATRYSAWLFLYVQLDNELDDTARTRLTKKLDPGPRADLQALARKFVSETSPRAREASRAVYDTFLKANRVDEGIASYEAVIRLILGTRFRDGFVPVLKRGAEVVE